MEHFSRITVKLYANVIFLPFRLIGNQDGALLKAAFYRHWMIKSRLKCETRTMTFWSCLQDHDSWFFVEFVQEIDFRIFGFLDKGDKKLSLYLT